MSKKTIAVLGLGSIGMRHARNFLNLGQSIVGFDPDGERRALLSDIGGVPEDARDGALARADAVAICSPNRMHLDDLSAAIDADCHVLVEKPLSHTMDGVASVLDRSQEKGLVVFSAFNLRYHPGVQALRAAVATGKIGKPLWARFSMSSYLPDWRPAQDYRAGYTADPATGGVLFDLIHEFDMANYVLGPAVTHQAVAWRTGALDMPAEDCAEVVLAHESGAKSAVHVDYCTPVRQRLARIAGTEGVLELDVDGRTLTRHGVGGGSEHQETFAGSYDDDYVAEARAFLQCMEGNAIPESDGRQALAVLEQVIVAREKSGLQ